MNEAQLHLLFNHFPVIGIFFLIPLLIFAIKSTSNDIKRVALLGCFLVALSTFPAYFTGDPAQDLIEALPSIDKKALHIHEEAADFALVAGVVLFMLSLGGLFIQKRRPEHLQKYLKGLVVISLWAASVWARTAHEGGKIRHTELSAPALDPATDKDTTGDQGQEDSQEDRD